MITAYEYLFGLHVSLLLFRSVFMEKTQKSLFSLFIAVLGAAFIFTGCFTDSEDDSGDTYNPGGGGGTTPQSYTLTVTNRTEGMLDYIRIGSGSDITTCSDISRNESCSKTYSSKPTSSIRVSQASSSDKGYENNGNSYHYPGTGTSGTMDLILPGSYYALWVENSSSYQIDFIGFEWNTTTRSYAEGWNLIHPIVNNGLIRFMGFIRVTTNDVDLWYHRGQADERYWEWVGVNPGTNSYGSKYHILQAL